jgi:hypothetical protein
MADSDISGLPTATALTGTEQALLSQAGVDVNCTLNVLREFGKWTRPADWPALPADAANKISMIAAVFPDAGNIVAVNVTVSTGTWSMTMGDGTTYSGLTSAATQAHTYSYADGDLPAATTRGYKCAVVTITPDTGGATITGAVLGPSSTNAINSWLDILVNAPSCTALTFNSGTSAYWVERIRVTGLGAITTMASKHTGMVNLKVVEYPAGSMAAVTTMASCFSGARGLQRIDMRGWGFDASLTTATNVFENCSGLVECLFDTTTFDSITSASSMFNGCQALPRLTISLAAVTTLASAFRNMGSCTRIEITSLGAVTTIADMCNSNFVLRELIFPSASWASSLATTTSAFASCSSLSRTANFYSPVGFTLPGRHAAAQLDEVYTNLPSVTATIVVTGNYGTSADDPSIATGKGWTVTGS